MRQRIPTKIGDVLILQTTRPYIIHAIGRVSKDGQQDFVAEPDVKHESDRTVAVAQAKALVAPDGRIFLRNIDTGDWSGI